MADLIARGAQLYNEGRLSEAIDNYMEGLAHAPTDVAALSGLANSLAAGGRWPEANAVFGKLLNRLDLPMFMRIASNYLSLLQYQPECAPAELKRITAIIAAKYGAADPLPPRPPSSPLRIGFVSGDLCDHPVGMYLVPLIEHLDRARFQPILYDTGSRNDVTSFVLGRLAERYTLAKLDIEAVVAWLRRDNLDVAIDLSGHTGGHRLPEFARRVAPVQISWLGYSATTGIAAMDAVLMDPWHVPEGNEHLFTERIVRMPNSRFCYRPMRFAPEVSPPPCLTRGYVTFGSFNNTAKYNAALIKTWAEILARVEGSRLILKWRNYIDPAFCEQTWQSFEAHGIARDRVELRQASPHREVLEQYADIDIALDPFPFSGGQTSCEAMWMGLSVVSLPSERPVSRQTLGFVANLGCPDWQSEWIADTPDAYVSKACALAADPERLRDIRSSLREVMRRSPLMDEKQFARDFEASILDLIQQRAETTT